MGIILFENWNLLIAIICAPTVSRKGGNPLIMKRKETNSVTRTDLIHSSIVIKNFITTTSNHTRILALTEHYSSSFRKFCYALFSQATQHGTLVGFRIWFTPSWFLHKKKKQNQTDWEWNSTILWTKAGEHKVKTSTFILLYMVCLYGWPKCPILDLSILNQIVQ